MVNCFDYSYNKYKWEKVKVEDMCETVLSNNLRLIFCVII